MSERNCYYLKMKLKAVFVLLCKRLHKVCLTEGRRTATFPKHMWDMQRKKSVLVSHRQTAVCKQDLKNPPNVAETAKRTHSKRSRKYEEIHNWLRRSINRRRSSHGACSPYGAAHVFPAVVQGGEWLLIQVSTELRRPRNRELCVNARAGFSKRGVWVLSLNFQCVRVNWR